MAFRYRVLLQIFHPSADPDDISRRLGRTPTRSWAVGEPRHTPKGTQLPGSYRETYCAFDLEEGADGELARCLSNVVDAVEEAAPLFHDLRATGGRAHFYVQWYAGERGEVFSSELLFRIAKLGVDLGIEPLSNH